VLPPLLHPSPLYREEEVAVIVQEGTQNERCPQANTFSKISHLLLGESETSPFSRSSLISSDPPFIKDLEHAPYGFSLFIDYDLNYVGGWAYATDFASAEWSEEIFQSAVVRKRKVYRLFVRDCDLSRALLLKESWRSSYRSIHPMFISAALEGYQHKIEMVVEYQRLLRDRYDSYNLIYSDPAQWNFALPYPPATAPVEATDPDFVDPTSCPLSYLRPLDQCTSFKLIDGWQILHDFIHVLHPCKDEMGWQYSNSFLNDCDRLPGSRSHWSRPSTDKGRPLVRRRLWMRTLVRDCDLEECRVALDAHIAAHPRGVIFSSRLQRRSSYRKRWCDAAATLRDDAIEIRIENNYQKFVTYSLHGCEPVLLSQLSGEGDLMNKFFLFGLRRIGGARLAGLPVVENHLDPTGGVFCILNAPSAELRDRWVSALTHQLLLVNTYRFLRQSCSQWCPVIGPPCLVDVPYITGRLWKKGDLVWKFRTFELRKSGILAYFKRGRLIGEVKLLNECSIQIPPDISFQFPFDIMTCDGTSVLRLAASDAETRQRWMTALRWSISAAWERKVAINSAVVGKKKEHAGVFWYDGEVDLFETPSSHEPSYNFDDLKDKVRDFPSEEGRAGVCGSPNWMLMMVGLTAEGELGSYSSEIDHLESLEERELRPCHAASTDRYSHWTANYSDSEEEGGVGVGRDV
jgi:hypothetical protein